MSNVESLVAKQMQSVPTRKVKARRRARGAAMLLVMIALAVASVLALSFLRSSGPTMAVASNNDKHNKARAVAESGLEFAIEYVKNNDNWRSTQSNGLWLADEPLDGGTFSVYGTDDDGDLSDDASDTLNLSVVAIVDGVTHRVSARVDAGTETLKLKVMFVVRNASSLTAEESQKQALFESWGYTVSILDDGAGQATFDTAAAESEVAFISSDASFGTVGSKLQTHPLGVVYELAQMSYYFDIATDGGLASGTQIDIVDNTHYVTSVFDTGVLTIADSSITLHRNRTNVASGADRIAEPTYNDDYALLTVETGAALLNSNTAPARRVKLPWTGDTSALNADGRLLTRRALEWASANEGGAIAQLLVHYEFDQVLVEPVLIGHWPLDDAPSGAGGSVQISGKLEIENGSILDAYDSSAGAYGGVNRQLDARFVTNSTSSNYIHLKDGTIYGDVLVGSGGDPSTVIQLDGASQVTGTISDQASNNAIENYSAPSGFGGHSGNQTYNGGSHTWSSDQHFNKLTLKGGARVNVTGDVAVRVSNMLALEDGDIILNPGATLILWVGHNITVENGSTINNDTSRPRDFTLIQYGNNRNMDLTDGAVVGAVHVANDLTIENASAIYGSVIAEGDIFINDGAIHADLVTGPPSDGSSLTPAQATDTIAGNDGATRGDTLGGQPGATPLAGSGFTMYFDGDGDYVEMPHISAYALDGGTFSCWFNADTTSGRQGLFSKDSTDYDTGGHFSVFIENGKVRVRMQSTTTSYWVESGNVSTNTWYHIMFAWGAGGMVLYLDGVAVDTNPYTGGLSSTSGGTGNFEPIVLGGNAWQSDDLLATPVKDYFHGFIDDLRIYDERLSDQQAIDLFNGIEPGGQLSETLVEDTSGFEDPLNLAIADPSDVTWSAGTLSFDASTAALSLGDATKVYDAVMATGEFSIVARLSRASPGGATGPAGIVSMSSSTGSRNFTLGQESSAFDMRVRTSTTGANGILSPDYRTGSILMDDDYVHVVVAYDGEALKTFVDGTLVKSELLGGSMTSWSAAMPLLLGNEVGGSRPWLGTLDEVSIYDRALSVSQSDALASGTGLVAQDPKAVWDEAD